MVGLRRRGGAFGQLRYLTPPEKILDEEDSAAADAIATILGDVA